MKLCSECPDLDLCCVLDDPAVQFLPEKAKLSAISSTLGREVSREEISRVESCLFRKEWLPL